MKTLMVFLPKKLTFIVFLILLSKIASGNLAITEIMFNPPGDDYDFEYIEIYSNQTNVSEWYFNGITFTFPKNTSLKNYTIIANTCFDEGADNDFIDKYNTTCDFEYSGSLSNSGENISLLNGKGELIQSVFYDKDIGADGDGNSLQLINKTWYASIPTPRTKNILQQTQEKENPDNKNSQDSSIKIESVDKDIIQFGEIINIKLYVKKGETSKYSISIFVEDKKRVSYTSKIRVYGKNKEYKFTVPVHIKCNKNYGNGYYYVKAEGLGTKDTKKIKIKGDHKDCETKEKIVEKIKYKTIINQTTETITFNPLDEFKDIEGKIIVQYVVKPKPVYESSDLKAKSLIPFFLVFIFALLAIILIWKR